MNQSPDTGLRTIALRLLVRIGLLPADSLLLYTESAFEWKSGFGQYAHFIYGLVRAINPKLVVEIGAAYGKSTCFLASALQRNGHGRLISIDPHSVTEWNDGAPGEDTFLLLQERLRDLRLTPFVSFRRMWSRDAALVWGSDRIDVLLVDGAHGVEAVREDFELFRPHLADGALVLFHDTMWEYRKDTPWYRADMGVPEVVQGLQDSGYPAVTLTAGWGLTILQNAPGGFRLWSPPGR